jgi:hypothetical protein
VILWCVPVLVAADDEQMAGANGEASALPDGRGTDYAFIPRRLVRDGGMDLQVCWINEPGEGGDALVHVEQEMRHVALWRRCAES